MEAYHPPGGDRHSTLEVVPPPNQNPYPQPENTQYNDYKGPPMYAGAAVAEAAPPRNRRKMIIIIVLVVAVIAAVVGGVVGGLVGGKKHSGGGSGAGGGGTGGGAGTAAQSSTGPAPTMSGPARSSTGYTYPTPVSISPSTIKIITLPTISGSPIALTHIPPPSGSSSTTSSNTTSLSLSGLVSFPVMAAISRTVGVVDLFVRGADGAMWHKYFSASTNSWGPTATDWEPRGGYLNSPPSAVSWSADRLDIYVTGGEDALYTMTWTAATGWYDWNKLGGNWASYAPTSVTWGTGRIDVFVVGSTDSQLYHTWLEPGGSVWQPQGTFETLGGYLAGRPVAVSWGSGRLDVFARGGDAGLWHLAYPGTVWGNWTRVDGGTIQAEPEAVSPAADRIEAFVWRADDGGYERRTLVGGKWEATEVLGGGPFSGPPKAAVDGEFVRVYGYDSQGRVLYRAWDWRKEAWLTTGWESLGNPAG